MKSKIIGNLLRNKFSQDTIWLTLAQIVLTGSGLLINLVISAEFGKASLGIFNQVLGLYMILTVLFSMGVNASIVQKVASSPSENTNTIFSSGLFITATCSLLLTTISLVIVITFPHLLSSKEVVNGFLITATGIPLFNLNKNFMALLTGRKEQKMFSIIRGLRWFMIIFFIGINTLFIGKTIFNFLALPLTEIILVSILIRDNRKYLTKNFSKSQVLENFSFGIKSFIAEVFAILNNRLDIVVIGYFLSKKETGVFSFYIFFVKAIFIFPGILNQNFKPIFAKHWKENKVDHLKNAIRKIKRYNLLITLASTTLLSIFYFILVNYFYVSYFSSYSLFIVNILTAIPTALISWGGGLLLMAGKLKENNLRTLIILIVSTISLIFFTYQYGLLGAAIATSFTFIFTFIMLYSFVKRIIGIKLI